MTIRRGLGVMALMAFAGAGQSVSAQSAYLDFDALSDELQSLANGSNEATLQSIATTIEGREIWMLELARPDGPPAAERPGVLIVGNLEGDHLLGSQLSLGVARYLLSGEGGTEEVLSRNVFYIVPRLNPDGAEAWFDAVKTGRTTNARRYDDDNDGRVDEDPVEDLNGDGVITVMRVADPLGPYIPHPDDPRLMAEADPTEGQAGAYTLYWEGVDSDGDGFYNEDGPGGVDLNRNFQHEHPYYGQGAGPYMVSEPESRGLIDFAISHRNIATVLTFGHSDNLVTPPNAGGALADAIASDLASFADASLSDVFNNGVFPTAGSARGGLQLRGAQPGADNDPSSGQRPAVTVDAADLEYFATVSEAYRETTGIERVDLNRTAMGAFFQYGYYQFGVPSFTTSGWALSEPEEEEEGDGAGTDGQLLANSVATGVDAFVEWTAFDHPQLGSVEIGGFRPYVIANPPAEELADLGRRHGEFVVTLADMLPNVRITDSEVESHGGGIFTVTVEVANQGFFPSSTQHGVRSRSVNPVTVQIQVDNEDLITGDAKTSTIAKLDGSGTRRQFSWVIRGQAGSNVEIRVRTQKSGNDSVTVRLGGDQ